MLGDNSLIMAAAMGPVTGETSLYDSEEEVSYSNGSSTGNDHPMDENVNESYDEDESSNDMSVPENGDGEASLPLPPVDTTVKSTMIDDPKVSPKVSKTGGETLEENNNDPPKKMSSMEMNNDADEETEAAAAAVDPDESIQMTERQASPNSDCNNLKREWYILNLVSQINLASIVSWTTKNPKIPISEIKLWDLIPENERIEFSWNCTNVLGISSDKISTEDPAMKINLCNNAEIGTSDVDSGNVAKTMKDVKRGPADDICIIECKKSSSGPENSTPQPKNVASTSKIVQIAEAPPARLITNSSHQKTAPIPQKIVTPSTANGNHRGAIPKVRNNISKKQPAEIKNNTQAPHGFNRHETVEVPHGHEGVELPHKSYRGERRSALHGFDEYERAQSPHGFDGYEGVQDSHGFNGHERAQAPHLFMGSERVQTSHGFNGPERVQAPHLFMGSERVQTSHGFNGPVRAQAPHLFMGSERVQTPHGFNGPVRAQAPHLFMGPERVQTSHGFNGPERAQAPHLFMGSERAQTSHGFNGPVRAQAPHLSMGSERAQTSHGFNGPVRAQAPHLFMGPEMVQTPHGFNGPVRAQAPHLFMGPQRVQNSHGFNGPERAQAPHLFIGSERAQTPHGFNGPVRAQAPHGYNGPERAQAPHGFNGPETAQTFHGINGPERVQAPHGYNGPERAQAPHGFNGPERVQAPHGYNGPERAQSPHLFMGSERVQTSHGFNGPERAQAPHLFMGSEREQTPHGFNGPERAQAPHRFNESERAQTPHGFNGPEKAQAPHGFNGPDRVQAPQMDKAVKYESQDLALVIRETAAVRMQASRKSSPNKIQSRNKSPPSQMILQAQQNQQENNNDTQLFEERENLPIQHHQEREKGNNIPLVNRHTADIYETVPPTVPDADTEYLQEFAEENVDKPDAVGIFMSDESLDSPKQQQPQNPKRVICMEIYCKLRNLFPTVDRDYIKKLCPSEWGPGDHEPQVARLVEHLLERNNNIPMTSVDTANAAGSDTGEPVDIYETLLAIVPDADTEYLREFAEANAGKPDAVKTFLSDETLPSPKICQTRDKQQHNESVQTFDKRNNTTMQQQQVQQERQQGAPQQPNNALKSLEKRTNLPIQQQQQEQQRGPGRQQLQFQYTEKKICMEIYRRLRNVFPNVEPDYIIKVCPPEWGPGDHDAQIATLVECLLEGGDNLPKVPIDAVEVADNYGADESYTGGPDHMYETLLAIVPDADPDFLIKFAEDNAGVPDAVKKFATNKNLPSPIIRQAQQEQLQNNVATALEEGNDPPMLLQQQEQQQPQEPERVICMEIYCRLRSIFPNVDADYIRNLCPPEWGPGDRDAQIAPLVEHLLEKEHSLNMMPADAAAAANYGAAGAAAAAAVNTGGANYTYETLIAILPNADPEYLRKFAKENVSDPEAVKAFVISNLEKGDYPTRAQYMTRMKISQEQKQYRSGFDIKNFLTIIPDPFKHFLDLNRKCKYSQEAFEFLKTHFRMKQEVIISRLYKQARYNLSQAAEDLEVDTSLPAPSRLDEEIVPQDIRLLQETAFIKNKNEIHAYMENVKRQEEAEFKMLKEQNFLIECPCCYDGECVPSKCSNCSAGHIFCNNCVISGATSKMGEGETRISCFVNCGGEFSLSTLREVLPPTTFSILLKKRQAAEVIEAGLEGLVSCPFCHFASIPPEEDKVFKCLNPECTKESCRLCKELSHVPLKCDEVMKAEKARCYIEEKMTEALARKCYKCKRAYFKEEGCNKITCPCGAKMCYLCDQPINDYRHFRGQGAAVSNLCPLYSDTIRLDAVAVREVAKKAEIAVMKLNPNIKIDTAKLLPTLPAHGPYRETANEEELTRHAQRVLDLQPEPL